MLQTPTVVFLPELTHTLMFPLDRPGHWLFPLDSFSMFCGVIQICCLPWTDEIIVCLLFNHLPCFCFTKGMLMSFCHQVLPKLTWLSFDIVISYQIFSWGDFIFDDLPWLSHLFPLAQFHHPYVPWDELVINSFPYMDLVIVFLGVPGSSIVFHGLEELTHCLPFHY